MKTEKFKVDGYSIREVTTAVHEAGHAVAVLRVSQMAILDSKGERVTEIVLRGSENQQREGGHCRPNGLLGYLDDIVLDLAGHQAERACGFPRDCFSPNFGVGSHGYRDKDYQMAVESARGFFYSEWAVKEIPLLSEGEQGRLLRQSYRMPKTRKDRLWHLQFNLATDLRKRHRVSLRKLRPILDHCVRRTRQLVRRPENLQLIKAIAVALLQAPKNSKGDRVLTGKQISKLALARGETK
jgi:hypothetical protein